MSRHALQPLQERLDLARRGRFVGRSTERDILRSALAQPEFPFFILYVYGPGGVGKTSLLREYVYQARRMDARAVLLDGRNVDPAPELLLGALNRALGAAADADPIEILADTDQRTIILIDTYEMLSPLDGWLRDDFLPQLPANVLTVLAGREPPDVAWRVDPGWQTLLHVLQLRNLSPEESRAYLVRREVPADRHAAVLEFTHGHPLALSLVADVFAQRPDAHFRPEEAPDVIKTLLDQLIREAPTPDHRAALEACAMVRLTTESLLGAMVKSHDVHALFEWLRDLSFVDADRRGIYPHDLAREALAADLRWRDPDRYAELHERARGYYMAHLQTGDPQDQRRLLGDYIYLHRDNPAVRPYFEWQMSGAVYTDVLRPEDAPEIVAMVEQAEGREAARLAAHWLERQPDRFSVFRQSSGETAGFLFMLAMERADEADRALDPAFRLAWNHLMQHAPLRPGETATAFRFWMSRDAYQSVSPVQTRAFLNMVQHYLTTSDLVYTYILCADPDFWLPAFSYGDMTRLPELDFSTGGRQFGFYGHNWRTTPPLAWLDVMAGREVGGLGVSGPARPAEPLLVLSESDFGAAVRNALRDYADPAALASNPLLRSRLLLNVVGGEASKTQRIAALQGLLREAVESLQQSPRQLKYYRAIYHTYIQPAATQEQAAELLDLPFSTYRRHLRAGIEQVTDRLWLREVGE